MKAIEVFHILQAAGLQPMKALQDGGLLAQHGITCPRVIEGAKRAWIAKVLFEQKAPSAEKVALLAQVVVPARLKCEVRLRIWDCGYITYKPHRRTVKVSFKLPGGEIVHHQMNFEDFLSLCPKRTVDY